ncbi:hypothetical protein CYMTET_33983 [Cymbomonas tetramitiformis]|uniref:Uncharacterized protein n=1 Tax=Cymbomonas tetramitiformis TaxID=36881 RepID=A0AAE0FCL9_9CHLO|nr:hypothetical protein CYMTET_33983 [Cymbomonas tetramitiformis]
MNPSPVDGNISSPGINQSSLDSSQSSDDELTAQLLNLDYLVVDGNSAEGGATLVFTEYETLQDRIHARLVEEWSICHECHTVNNS